MHIRPRFWNQPEHAPHAPLEHPCEHPANALAKHADDPAMFDVSVGREPEFIRPDPQCIGILSTAPISHHPQHGYCYDQPVPGCPIRVCSSGVLPLPSHALEGTEPQFYPDSKPIPTHSNILWSKVCQHYPGLSLLFVPHHNQSAEAMPMFGVEGCASAHPCMSRPWYKSAGWHATASYRLKHRIAPDAHHRMPSLGTNLLPEPWRPQSSVGHHKHTHVFWDRRLKALKQARDGTYPGASCVGRQYMPSYRDGASSVQHTHHQGSEPIRMQGGIYSQSQLVCLPPGQQLSSQRGKTEADFQLSVAGTGTLRAIIKPFSQSLAHRVPKTQTQKGSGNSVLAGASSDDGPIDPQHKAATLRWSKMTHVLCNGPLHLIAFSWKAHGITPVSRYLDNSMMTDNHALSYFSFRLHTPVSLRKEENFIAVPFGKGDYRG